MSTPASWEWSWMIMIKGLDDQPHDRQLFPITYFQKGSYVAEMLHAHQYVSLEPVCKGGHSSLQCLEPGRRNAASRGHLIMLIMAIESPDQPHDQAGAGLKDFL